MLLVTGLEFRVSSFECASQSSSKLETSSSNLSQILNLKSVISNQLHAIHVSVSEINYSEKDKALQISSRIFIDDLELAIRSKLNSPELDLLHPPTGQTIDLLVSDYLTDHLKFKLDNKPVKIHYLGHEIEDLAIICYIEIESVKKFKTLEVYNSVIQEIHNDQSNLVHITYKGPVKSFRLMKEKPSDIFKVETKQKS
jgi:hypothetical protein